MVKGVSTIFAWVKDMDKGVAFYRDVLGLKCTLENPHWSMFDVGGLTLALHAHPGPSPKDGWVLCVDVDDLDALEGRLVSAGIAVDPKRHDTPSGWVMVFADPEGNAIQAIQPK